VSRTLELADILILPLLAAALAACNPSPQESAMRSPASPTATRDGIAAPSSTDAQSAALGPIAQPVSAAENPAPAARADPSAEALGRRILSTAFVRVGPDGILTVERRDGRTLHLRNVVMRRTDYCGTQLLGDHAGAKYCGGYAEVAAARPGDAPAPEPLDPRPNPVDPAQSR
jgi:hypothetical protein